MAKTIKVKKPADFKKVQKILEKGLTNPFKSTRSMFLMLGAMVDRDSQLTFKNEGQYLDRNRWIGFGNGQGVGYYLNKNGTFKKRPGTDKSKSRRYSSGSKLLQASGMFKQSFRILKIGLTKMTYGTKHRLAEEIMGNNDRQVLQYTGTDQRRYSKVIINWFNKKIKF